ncbi:MAG: DUF2085 domain-containing protein [bacterium]
MWLSHHPPCDYDHTLLLGSVRVCARCSGIMIGILLALASLDWWRTWPTCAIFATVILLPIPAVADFLRHEGFGRPSNNARRCSTGLLIGVVCGMLLAAWRLGAPLVTFGAIAWLILLEFAVMLTLRATGTMDSYAARYEDAVVKKADE